MNVDRGTLLLGHASHPYAIESAAARTSSAPGGIEWSVHEAMPRSMSVVNSGPRRDERSLRAVHGRTDVKFEGVITAHRFAACEGGGRATLVRNAGAKRFRDTTIALPFNSWT